VPSSAKKHLPTLSRDLKDCNLVLEVRDVRLPLTSKLPFLERKFESKRKVLLLTKSDKASAAYLEKVRSYLKARSIPFHFLSPSSKPGAVRKLFASLSEKYEAKGSLLGVLRVMITGFPNVGKSTIINTVRGKKVARVANVPGVTKGRQWIKINSRCYLLDTPGVASLSHTKNRTLLMKYAACRMVSESTFDMEELASFLHHHAISSNRFHGVFSEHFVPLKESYEDMIRDIGSRFAMKISGGKFDRERIARKFFEFVEHRVLPDLDLDEVWNTP
jgi:ribosome biogenesis GTPase A